MTTRRLVVPRLVLSAWLLGLGACGGVPPRPPAPPGASQPRPRATPDSCEDVRATVARQLQALRERDAEHFLEAHAEVPEAFLLGPVDVAIASGSEAVTKTLRRVIEDLPSVQVRADERGCAVVGDTAWSLHEVVLRPDGAATRSDGLPEQLTYYLVQVHRRLEGTWRVVVASWGLALTAAQVREWTARSEPSASAELGERHDPSCDGLASALEQESGSFELEVGPAPTVSADFGTPSPPANARVERVGDLCVAIATTEIPFVGPDGEPVALPARVVAVGAAGGTQRWLRTLSVVVPQAPHASRDVEIESPAAGNDDNDDNDGGTDADSAR